jgi:signal transduction histidine kinase
MDLTGDLSAIVHDLRTPLNVLLGHTQLLALEHLTAAGRRRLDIIEAQARHIATLNDSCLPQQSPHVHAAFVDVDTIIREVVAELDLMLRQRAVQILVSDQEPLPKVIGDREALHRVLVNLMVNAADSMPGGGRIFISARTARLSVASVSGVAIEIADTGGGIPPEVVSHVFDRGFTTKPPRQGAGLGLAICREIVQAHGGRIELSSEEGSGTTARLSLPIGPAAGG